jgi:hypothetical protein
MKLVLNDSVENIKALHGIPAADGIRLLVGTKVQTPGGG